MYKIDKNIPIPKSKTKRTQYPWREMAIGDSIFVSDEEAPPSGAYTTPSYFALRNPEYKFTTRKVDGGYRIWRIPCPKNS